MTSESKSRSLKLPAEAQITYDLESQDLEILTSTLTDCEYDILKNVEQSEDDEIYENLKKQTEMMFLEDENDKADVSTKSNPSF